MSETEIKVNMTGTEYIKYKESIKSKLKPREKQGLAFIFGSLMLGMMSILFIPEIFREKVSIVYSYVDLFGVRVSSNLIVLVVVSICIAWVVHGFGFILVKASR